ncbi:MAG: CRTAC1 family protein [Gammaproteobacteria bacterium]|nr:CRTAC1 family protein [Gammaproteobacteria bacterium]
MTEQSGDAERPDGEQRIRRALRTSLVVAGVVATGAVAVFSLITREPAVVPPAEHRPAGPNLPETTVSALPALRFTDITREAGIDFVHEDGAYGERLLPETMGGGVAFLDYDNDDDQDLLFVNSATWPWRPAPATPSTSRLYRNRGDGSFEDVTETAALDAVLYGMGVAVGDYDGDGFVDIFVTAVGENRLFRNLGGQRFADVTVEAGVGGSPTAWSTSAAFADIDDDGDLDLFVCNYVAWSPEIDREVDYRLTGIGRAYGPPTDFPGSDSYLYRNDDGKFVDVSAAAGIVVANPATGQPVGKALAVLPADVDGDHRVDFVVANDTVRNFLFLNQGEGKFREAGVDMGLAFDSGGAATGAMGVDAARFDNDGKLAVVIGNFANEMSSFYVSRPGERLFSDDAIVSGVGAPSRRALTFGVFFFDADLDGRLDVLASNGHVEPEIQRVQASQTYSQPTHLFWDCGVDCPRRYALLDQTGDLDKPIVGRGAAYADIDLDGDLDVVLTQVGGPAVLFRNDQALGHNWIRLRLASQSPNPHSLGAVVTAEVAGLRQVRVVNPARSYLSHVELPVTFGLGTSTYVDELTVRWPSGARETWANLPAGRSYVLRQGGAERESTEPQ